MFFFNSHMRKKPFILYHVADLSSKPDQICLSYVFPCRIYFSRIRLLQSVYHPKHRRLSTSRSADHRQKFAFFHNNAHIIQCFISAKAFRHMFQTYHFHTHSFPCTFLFLLESFFKRFCSHGFRKIFYSNPDVFKNSSATSASSRPSSST